MKYVRILVWLFVMGFWLGDPARAQILTVTGEYRVVNVDRPNQRVGIALREDNPNRRQNWVYIRPETQMIVRKSVGNGAFRDEKYGYNEIFEHLHKGSKLRVHGGRDWNGSILAKKIWM